MIILPTVEYVLIKIILIVYISKQSEGHSGVKGCRFSLFLVILYKKLLPLSPIGAFFRSTQIHSNIELTFLG